MTFLELVEEVWRKCALTGTGPGSVTSTHPMESRIIRYASDAYEFVQQKHDDWAFRWMRRDSALVIGQQVYQPTDFVWTVFNKLSRVLLQDDFGRWYPIDIAADATTYEFDNPGAGTPTKIGVLPNGDLVFNAIPDETTPIRGEYYRSRHVLSTNTTNLLIPSAYVQTVVYKAAEYYAIYDEDTTLMQEAKAGFAAELARMERALLPQVEFSSSPFFSNE